MKKIAPPTHVLGQESHPRRGPIASRPIALTPGPRCRSPCRADGAGNACVMIDQRRGPS